MGTRTLRKLHAPLLRTAMSLMISGCTGLISDPSGPGLGKDTDNAQGDPNDGFGSVGDTDGPGGGASLPPDVTPEQLANGKKQYEEMCASCHGADGSGGPFKVPLTRDMGFENLVSYIDAEMPKGNPELCVDECAHDVAAHVQKNFVIPSSEGGGAGVKPVCEGELPAPRMMRLLTRREYRNTVRDLLGVAAPDTEPVPVEPRVRGYDNNAAASVVTSRHVDEYVALGDKLADTAVRTRKAALLPCDAAASSCPRDFVQAFGLRAFRRPLEAAEVDAYGALFASELTQGSFDVGMRLAMQAMLISPNFLYRSEMGEVQADGSYRLSAYETASALSYTFIGSMPDAALLQAAKEGKLGTKAELEAQARRLLKIPAAREQVEEFVTQWLRTESLLSANKDSQIYPTFSNGVREAMFEEQRRLVGHLFFETKGTYQDLLLADYTFVNQPLATFYGLPAPSSDFAQVSVPASSNRGGILGLGSVMASHAHSNESSPIKRGLFVRDRLLCQDLPPPPANLDTTPPGLDPTLTTRERFGQHTADPSCKGCHQYIDGVGFGLEGFDGVGAARSVENNLPVDTSGELVGLESLGGTDSHPYEGSRGLAEVIASSENAQGCLPLQLYRFARGYQEGADDTCSVESLRERFTQGGQSLQDMLVDGTQLDNFLVRK